MEFDFQWLLIGLPVAFALGWMASRFDLRQLKREREDAPRAYFKGLNLLLNEQQDKAIDAFIEAVQNDPDTTELHFALGNLFRRRGEFERAVRVHEHLLGRADLAPADRMRAQLALAQDFMKAGLFDRAEEAWHAVEGSAFDGEARLALLSLYERSRDWPRAIQVAQRLEADGSGSFASRIAHYECEIAGEADARGQPADIAAADAALARARQAAPHAPRPLLMAGQRLLAQGKPDQAVAAWDALLQQHPASFLLVAADYAKAAQSSGQPAHAHAALEHALQHLPAVELLQALQDLEHGDGNGADASASGNGSGSGSGSGSGASGASGTGRGFSKPAAQVQRLVQQLQLQPTLSAAQLLLQLPPDSLGADAWDALRGAVARSARPLQRYRCAACGFEAQHYFWQCPGCLSWDSYPPQRIDSL